MSKNVFALAWLVFFSVITFIVLLSFFVISIFVDLPNWSFGLLALLPFIYTYLVWNSRVEVPPKMEYIYEWLGKRMSPFKNGITYIFPYFNLLKGIARVPMNNQTLYILIGRREGLDKAIIEKYFYGDSSDIEPENGDAIRVLCALQIRCVDSLKLVYEVENPYQYIVDLVQVRVGAYMKKLKLGETEKLSDYFLAKDWDEEIFDETPLFGSLKEKIFDTVGVELIHFVPVDLIFSPEVEEIRRKTGVERQRKEFLKEQLSNMKEEEDIAKRRDDINSNSIKKIMDTANVSGPEALGFLMKEKTLKTVESASKNGSMTYLDSANEGNFSNGVGFGWGFNATNKKAETKDKEEKVENNKKNKK